METKKINLKIRKDLAILAGYSEAICLAFPDIKNDTEEMQKAIYVLDVKIKKIQEFTKNNLII